MYNTSARAIINELRGEIILSRVEIVKMEIISDDGYDDDVSVSSFLCLRVDIKTRK